MSWLLNGILSQLTQTKKTSEEMKQLLMTLVDCTDAKSEKDQAPSVQLLETLDSLCANAEYYHAEIGEAQEALFGLLRSQAKKKFIDTDVVTKLLRIIREVTTPRQEEQNSLQKILTAERNQESQKIAASAVEVQTVKDILKTDANVQTLVGLLDNRDSCSFALAVLTTLTSLQQSEMQDRILQTPNAVSKINDLILSTDEKTKTEAMKLLKTIAQGNEDIDKLLMFESIFEKLLTIIMNEGGNDGGEIVSDSLEIIIILLKDHEGNQTIFRESGHCKNLLPLLNLGEDKYLILEQKASIIIKTLKICSILARGSELSKRQLYSSGIMKYLLDDAYHTVHSGLITACFKTIGDIIIKYPDACTFFSTTNLVSEQEEGKHITPLSRTLQLALSQKLDARQKEGACRLLKCYFHENIECQLAAASSFFPQPDQDVASFGAQIKQNLRKFKSPEAVYIFRDIICGNGACKQMVCTIPVDINSSETLLQLFLVLLQEQVQCLKTAQKQKEDLDRMNKGQTINLGTSDPEKAIEYSKKSIEAFLWTFAEWFFNSHQVIKKALFANFEESFIEGSKDEALVPFHQLFCLLVALLAQEPNFWVRHKQYTNTAASDFVQITSSLEKLKTELDSETAKKKSSPKKLVDNHSSLISNTLGMFEMLSELTQEQREEKLNELIQFEKEEIKEKMSKKPETIQQNVLKNKITTSEELVAKELNSYKETIHKLNNEMEELRIQLQQQHELELHKAAETIKKLEEDIGRKETEVATYKITFEQVKSIQQKSNEEMNALKKELDDAKRDKLQLQENAAKQITNLTTTLTQYQEANQNAYRESIALNEQIEGLKKQNSFLTQSASDLEVKLKDASEKATKVLLLEKENAELLSKFNAFAIQHRELQESFDATQKALQALQAEKVIAEQKLKQQDESLEKMNSVVAQLEEARLSIEKLSKDKEELSQQNEVLRTEKATLSEQLHAATVAASQSSSSESTQQNLVSMLQKAEQESKARFEELEKKYQKLEKENQDMREIVEMVEQERDELQHALDEQKK